MSRILQTVTVLIMALSLEAHAEELNRRMQHIAVNGIDLAYEVIGEGEPVLLIHGDVVADSFALMIQEPALGNYQLINYHRRGMGQSADYDGAYSRKQEAADLRALLSHLDKNRVHLVGHASGGATAIQLAMDAPDIVQSMILLEPGIPTPEVRSAPSEQRLDFLREVDNPWRWLCCDEPLEPNKPRTREVVARATDAFMESIIGLGEDWETRFARIAPEVREQAIEFFYEGRLEAIERVDYSDYQYVNQPILAIQGEGQYINTLRIIELLGQLTDIQKVTIPGVGHGLQMIEPQEIAELIAVWLERHPI